MYVNERFTENLENIKTAGKVLVDSGVYKQSELEAKGNIVQERYLNIVLKEAETLLIILNKKILPRAYETLAKMPVTGTSMKQRKADFESHLETLVAESLALEHKIKSDISLPEAEKIRAKINDIGDLTNNVTDYLPADKDWPELYDILTRF